MARTLFLFMLVECAVCDGSGREPGEAEGTAQPLSTLKRGEGVGAGGGGWRAVCKHMEPRIQYDAEFCRAQCEEILSELGKEEEEEAATSVAKLRDGRPERNLFFKRCRFPEHFQQRVEAAADVLQSRCLLMSSAYRGSWVDGGAGSCHCEMMDAEPCTEEEVRARSEQVRAELAGSGLCPSADQSALFHAGRSIFYAALAGGRRLHCPPQARGGAQGQSGSERKDTWRPEIGTVEPEELESFCQHGPIHSHFSNKTMEKGWNYLCADVVSEDGREGGECLEACRQIERHCGQFDAELLECLKAKLTRGAGGILGASDGCHAPGGTSGAHFWAGEFAGGVDEFCREVFEGSEEGSKCLATCRAAEDMCAANAPRTKRGCLNALFRGGEEAESYATGGMEERVAAFRKKCRFRTANHVGRGLVLCRFREERCRYSAWSEWSECTGTCIDFDNMPTRYRTRELVGARYCAKEGLGRLEFQICAGLPTCRGRSWVRGGFGDAQVVGNFEQLAERRDRKQEWAEVAVSQYPEIVESTEGGDPECDGAGQDDVCVIIRAVARGERGRRRWSCPRGYRRIGFAAFRGSGQLAERLEELCRSSGRNKLVFEGRERHVFHCSLGMVVKELEKEEAEVNWDWDGTEHVPCERIGARGEGRGSWDRERVLGALRQALKYGAVAVGVAAAWSCWLVGQGYRVRIED